MSDNRAVHWQDSPVPFYPRRRHRPSPWSSHWDEALMDMDRKLTSMKLGPLIQSQGSEQLPGKYVVNVALPANTTPSDVKVSVTKQDGQKIMRIEAKKEEKSEDGSFRMYNEVTQEFTLPDNIHVEDLKSMLTGDHFLQIQAPLPSPVYENQEHHRHSTVEEGPKEIPIKRDHHGLGHYLKKLIRGSPKT